MLSRSRGLIALGLAAFAVAGCGKNGAQTEAGAGGAPGAGGSGSGGAAGVSGTGGASGGASGGSSGGSSGGGAGSPGTGGAGVTGGASGGAGHGAAGAAGHSAGGSGAAGAAGRPATGGSGGATGGSAAGGSGGAAGATAGAAWVTISNGGFWNDSSGKRIEAHGGGFIQVGDTWYWVGEDKSMNSGNFFGVNVYASKDLVTWQFRNAIITRQTSTDLAAADRIIERPKIIYNDSTKQYVMWLHWDGQSYATAQAGVFTCATVDGNYKQVSHFQPNSNMARDDSLFKDDDGKAYFMAAANNNQDMIIYQLADDYLSVKSQVVTVFAGKQREAPAMFKQGGRYYLITSAATGWDSNQAQYASATNIAGPWSSLTNIGDGTTFDTQSAFVIPYVGSQTTTYIFAGDRWQDPDLVSSKYIWIPIQISGTSLTLNDYAQWQLDVTTGHWSDDQTLIPQTNWSLISADSQETQGGGREGDQRVRRINLHLLAHAVHRQRAGPPPRDPDRSRGDLRPRRLPLRRPPGQQHPRDGRQLSVLRQRRQDQLGNGGRDGNVQRRRQRAARDVHPQDRTLHSVRRVVGGRRQRLDQRRRAAHGRSGALAQAVPATARARPGPKRAR